MNCEMVGQQLGAWCDRQLEPAQAAALEAHLSECAECRAAGEALRGQDAALRRAFEPGRAVAARVAERALAEFDLRPQAATVSPKPAALTGLVTLLLATAAGFLLAVFMFQPWKAAPQVGLSGPTDREGQIYEPPVAQLVAATGEVEVRQRGQDAWLSSSRGAEFCCPSGSEVRTGPNVQCELKTPEGGVIRLNNDTQITFAAADTIEIERGQIWCSTPESMAIKVLATANESPPPAAAEGWSVACASASCMQTAVAPGGDVQVSTSAGEIDVLTPSARQRLKGGEMVSIVQGVITKTSGLGDPLLSARWTQPLMILKGYDNRELGSYVDQLLSQVGRSKVSLLYEQDIRGLGEYAALPLIRYVESPLSQADPQRRQTAMRIVADIAPTWAIADLIRLLADTDPQTRTLAAATLERLTGFDQGRARDAWREDLDQCQPTIEVWQKWWADNRKRYSPPPSAASLLGSPT